MLEVKKENRFLIFDNTEKDKKLTFCLKDSQFYNDKQKPIKITTAKTFFKAIDYKDLPTDNNACKIALLLKFFKLASKNTQNIGTLIEKYCEFEYLESWLFDDSLLMYLSLIRLYDSTSKASRWNNERISIPYNKLNKDIKTFIKKTTSKAFQNDFSLNKSLESIYNLTKMGYNIEDYNWSRFNNPNIKEEDIILTQQATSLNKIFSSANGGLGLPRVYVELLNMQNTRYVNDTGMQQKAIKNYIDFCNKIFELQEKIGRTDLIHMCYGYADLTNVVFTLVDKFNHDITRTYSYFYDLLLEVMNERGSDDRSVQYYFERKIKTYLDYLEMRTRIYIVANIKSGETLTQESINSMLKSGRYVKYSEIEEQHDVAVKVLNNLEVKYNDVLFDLRKDSSLNDNSIDDYDFRVPNEANELAVEGAVLGNCVKSYIEKVMKGETQIVLLRKKSDLNTPNVVFEVRNNAIVQLEGKSRRKANMFESKAIREYIHNKGLICKVDLVKWKTPKKEEKEETLKEN